MNLTDAEMVLCGIGGMIGLAGLLPFLYANGEGTRTREQSLIYLSIVVIVVVAAIFLAVAIYDMLAN